MATTPPKSADVRRQEMVNEFRIFEYAYYFPQNIQEDLGVNPIRTDVYNNGEFSHEMLNLWKQITDEEKKKSILLTSAQIRNKKNNPSEQNAAKAKFNTWQKSQTEVAAKAVSKGVSNAAIKAALTKKKGELDKAMIKDPKKRKEALDKVRASFAGGRTRRGRSSRRSSSNNRRSTRRN